MNEVDVTETVMGKRERELEGWVKGTEFHKKERMYDHGAYNCFQCLLLKSNYPGSLLSYS